MRLGVAPSLRSCGEALASNGWGLEFICVVISIMWRTRLRSFCVAAQPLKELKPDGHGGRAGDQTSRLPDIRCGEFGAMCNFDVDSGVCQRNTLDGTLLCF